VTFRLYDVPGYDRPLRLSADHAEALGATEMEAVERPNKTATKAAWVEYAVSQGADPANAESSTRADLIDRYGG
jgi:hypothetical protein